MSSITIILILLPKRDDAIALVHIFELFIYYLCSLSFWTVMSQRFSYSYTVAKWILLF